MKPAAPDISIFHVYNHSFRFAQGTKRNEMSWLRATHSIIL